MPRGFTYFVLAGLFGLMGIAVDWAFVPHRRYSSDYFRTMAVFMVPAALCVFAGARAHR